MEQNHFFMVYMEGRQNPTCRHKTIESAEKEAKRLAEVHGLKTFVLCTLKSFKVNKFDVQNCTPPDFDNLPF